MSDDIGDLSKCVYCGCDRYAGQLFDCRTWGAEEGPGEGMVYVCLKCMTDKGLKKED